MKLLHIVGLMICLCVLVVGSVLALETVLDEITTSPSFASANYKLVPAGATTAQYCITQIAVKNIENTMGTSALIHFDTVGTDIAHFAPGAPASAETSFTLYDGATLVGTGTFGYQRLYDGVGTEIPGYQYLTFSQWNIIGLSGNKLLALNFDRTIVPIAGMHSGQYAAYSPAPPTGYVVFADGVEGVSFQASQWTTYNKAMAFAASYSVSKGIGLGIVGTIWKYGLTDLTVYNSRAFVINATSLTTAASDATLNDDALHFNIPVDTIYIAVLDANGNWHNTSTIFTTSPASYAVTYAINLNPTTITSTTTTSAIISADPSSSLLQIGDAAWSWPTEQENMTFMNLGTHRDQWTIRRWLVCGMAMRWGLEGLVEHIRETWERICRIREPWGILRQAV